MTDTLPKLTADFVLAQMQTTTKMAPFFKRLAWEIAEGERKSVPPILKTVILAHLFNDVAGSYPIIGEAAIDFVQAGLSRGVLTSAEVLREVPKTAAGLGEEESLRRQEVIGALLDECPSGLRREKDLLNHVLSDIEIQKSDKVRVAAFANVSKALDKRLIQVKTILTKLDESDFGLWQLQQGQQRLIGLLVEKHPDAVRMNPELLDSSMRVALTAPVPGGVDVSFDTLRKAIEGDVLTVARVADFIQKHGEDGDIYWDHEQRLIALCLELRPEECKQEEGIKKSIMEGCMNSSDFDDVAMMNMKQALELGVMDLPYVVAFLQEVGEDKESDRLDDRQFIIELLFESNQPIATLPEIHKMIMADMGGCDRARDNFERAFDQPKVRRKKAALAPAAA